MKRYFSMAWRKHEFRDELNNAYRFIFLPMFYQRNQKSYYDRTKCTPRPEWLFKELEEKNIKYKT
jgi:hypothetical protein